MTLPGIAGIVLSIGMAVDANVIIFARVREELAAGRLTLVLLNAFNITLTLPGIAGIVLSIGMAVDANVIIFARVREELAAGRAVKSALH